MKVLKKYESSIKPHIRDPKDIKKHLEIFFQEKIQNVINENWLIYFFILGLQSENNSFIELQIDLCPFKIASCMFFIVSQFLKSQF